MKAIMTFFLIVLLFACEEDHIVDSRLKPYLDSFTIEALKRGIKPQEISLTARTMEEAGKTKGDKVYINTKMIEAYSDSYSVELEVIVFHELGHCILNKKHDDSRKGFMNTSPCLNCYRHDEAVRLDWLDYLFQ
jgi:hypothetical protein